MKSRDLIDKSRRESRRRQHLSAVSKYEPETGAEWALTLPPGKDREATLKNIHGNWPKDDDAGSEAFAKKHGIGP